MINERNNGFYLFRSSVLNVPGLKSSSSCIYCLSFNLLNSLNGPVYLLFLELSIMKNWNLPANQLRWADWPGSMLINFVSSKVRIERTTVNSKSQTFNTRLHSEPSDLFNSRYVFCILLHFLKLPMLLCNILSVTCHNLQSFLPIFFSFHSHF